MGLQFDHGCQIFTARSPAFQQLVHQWQQQGAVQQWTGNIVHYDAATSTTSPASSSAAAASNGGFFGALSGSPVYVGTPSMDALCSSLAASPQLHQMRTGMRVTRAAFDKYGKWLLEGMPLKPVVLKSDREDLPLAKPWNLGVFDALVYADKMVAVQGAPGCMELLGAEPLAAAFDQMQQVGGSPLLSLMVAFKAQQPLLPFDAASISNSATLQWISHDSTKPGRQRSDGLQCWVAVSTPEFAKQLIGAGPDGRLPPQTPEYLASLAPQMYQELVSVARELVPEQALPEPVFVQCQRWGSGLPARPLGRTHVVVPQVKAAACGDFCLGGGIENAAESALAAAEAVKQMLPA